MVGDKNKVKKKTNQKTNKNKKSKISKKKETKRSAHKNILINQNIWPVEKDVLFRPDRFKYVRKLIAKNNCVFCEATENKLSLETLCFYKTEHSMILLNKFPYNSGHLLVIPRAHIGNILHLSETQYTDLQMTIRLAMQAVEKIYNPGGINLGLNHGAVAGAGIPEHTHYHLVPRWAGDLNFFPLIAETKVVIETLEQSYQKYYEYFQKIGHNHE